MAARKIKVYQCEFDGRYAYGMAVVAAYNKVQARKLANDRLKDGRGLETNFDRMLVTDLPDLAYTGVKGPSILVWSHFVE
jgi:hypothetical protein